METDLTPQISQEIAIAIGKLGGNPRAVSLMDKWQVNCLLVCLRADVHLLATIGSWRDTASDEQILDHLRTWNEGSR